MIIAWNLIAIKNCAFASFETISSLVKPVYRVVLISGFNSLIVVNMETLLVTLVIVYVFNLIVGLIPVFKVLFKRPAEILARTDL